MVNGMSPYAIVDGFRIINQQVANVINSVVLLEIVEVDDEKPEPRLEESTFNVAEKTRTLRSCVTAHDLKQYINRFYSISLTEDDVCMFDCLTDCLYNESEEFSLQE